MENFRMDSLQRNDIEAWKELRTQSLTESSREDKAEESYYILTDYQQGTYIYTDRVGPKNYLYTDSIISFEWKIFPEYKTVMGHKCQKAVCTYMGRTYEAWYAADIPVSKGPWKFWGLPGMILEIYDSAHQYAFTAIDMTPCAGYIILFPSRNFKITKTNFLKELCLYNSDPLSYLENNSVFRIRFEEEGNELVQKLKNNCRHLPMEILPQ